MDKREATRRVCAGAAQLLDGGRENRWLDQGGDGEDLPQADRDRMHAAYEELHRRGGVRE